MVKNVYNTTDPQKLLQLKRLEADSLLDVLRSINHAELKESQLCMIARNTLRAQLGVKRMVFLYEGANQQWVVGTRLGFPTMSNEAKAELLNIQVITEVNAENHPALSAMEGEYVIPIKNRRAPKAYFLIAEFADSEVERQNDLIFIETLGNILHVALQNKRLFKEKMEQEFLKKELQVAETIQKQLLISNFDTFREMDIFAMNVAHNRIGGDFYDILKKGKGHTFVCIADVAGKGIGAALLMSNLQANLRALSAQYMELTPIITELNHILYSITSGDKFVTLFLARVDSRSRRLTYINAGHNFPMFRHKGKTYLLEAGCIPLGIFPDIQPVEKSLSFDAGDCLFMYTDGLVDQHNKEGELLDGDRVQEEFERMEKQSAKEIVQHFRTYLHQYAHDTEMVDDVTMLGVKFL